MLSSYLPAEADASLVVIFSRSELEKMPMTAETARILSSTVAASEASPHSDSILYLRTLRELLIAELEVARICRRQVYMTMSDLLASANIAASRLDIATL